MSAALYLVVGSAGSGKSEVARRLAARVGAAHLDKDDLVSGLTEAALAAAGTDPDGREDNPFYRTVIREREYAALLRVAASNLRLGLRVVVDASFVNWFGEPGHLADLRRRYRIRDDVETTIVQVVVDGDVARERLRRRGLSRDVAKLAEWDRFWATSGNPWCSWTGARRVVVENSADVWEIDALVDRVQGR